MTTESGNEGTASVKTEHQANQPEKGSAPRVALEIVYTGVGDPRVHKAGCEHLNRERRMAASPDSTEQMTVGSRTEMAARVYADQIEESADEDAMAYVCNFHFAACVNLPFKGPEDHLRVLTPARRAQGFRSQQHVDAFYRAYDHTQQCPECQRPGKSILTDDGWQGTQNRCPEGARLERESFSLDD